MPGRQVQLREGVSGSLDLNAGSYALGAGSWTSAGTSLELGVIVQATTLTEVERLVTPIRQMLARAAAYAQELQGEGVWVWTKSCDNLPATAEIGATWRRKRVSGGTVLVPDLSANAAGRYVVQLTLTLTVDAEWQRAAALPLASCDSASSGSDGTITVGAGYGLTAPRVGWTASTGLTARYFWLYGYSVAHPATTTNFIKVGANIKAYWDETAKRFKMTDGTNSCQSSVYAFSVAQEVEVVFAFVPSTRMTIYVNGIEDGEVAACVFAAAETYTLVEATSDFAMVRSVQVWPTYFADATVTGLAAWGRPAVECPWLDPPADGKNTNACWMLQHVPGEAPAALRLVIGSLGATNFDQVRAALLVGRTAYELGAECESGTLGANTAAVADTDASGGNVARFTPADTAWVTRVTVTLSALAANVYKYVGTWRVLLACKDSAVAVNVNQVKWRLTAAGVATDWSEVLAAGATATRSLVDLGTVTIPPGAWPENAERASSTVYASDFLRLELQAANSVGSGGGTLDFDKVFLQPIDLEGVASHATLLVASQWVELDFISDPPAGVVVADWRTHEFAGWADWQGDRLAVLPVMGTVSGSLLWLFCYRDTAEQAWPNDTLTLTAFVGPRYLD